MVDGKLVTEHNFDCSTWTVNHIRQRVDAYFNAISWSCLDKPNEDCWSRCDDSQVRKTIIRYMYDKIDGRPLTFDYIKICWDYTQRIISEHVDTGCTLGEAWRNTTSYQTKWLNPGRGDRIDSHNEPQHGRGTKRKNDDVHLAEVARRAAQQAKDKANPNMPNRKAATGKGAGKSKSKNQWGNGSWSSKDDKWKDSGWQRRTWK